MSESVSQIIECRAAASQLKIKYKIQYIKRTKVKLSEIKFKQIKFKIENIKNRNKVSKNRNQI